MVNPQFDPYQAWLGIPKQTAETDHYQLLGLARFEEDDGKIRAAYQQRHSVVRTYEVGGYADQALQMLEELSAAYYCLTSAAGKVAYDEQLRHRAAEATEGSGAGTTVAESLVEPEAPIEPPPYAWAVEPPPYAAPVAPPPASDLGPAAPAAADGEPPVAPVIVTASMAACAGCGSPIPPQENCLIVPVAIDAEGNLRSALARAVRRSSWCGSSWGWTPPGWVTRRRGAART